MRSIGFRASSALVGLLAGFGPVFADKASAPVGRDALDYGFAFASALEVDPKDMGKAQLAIVRDYLHVGEVDAAAERADEIRQWQRGVALAEVARALAEEGRVDRARAFVSRAEEFRKTVTGWENPRIRAHVAQALAALGEVERSEELARELASADDLQYTGRGAAAVVSALAGEGRYDEAMNRLRALEDNPDYEVSLWRTRGYLTVSRHEGFTREQRGQALEAATRSAEDVAGWKRLETLQEVARELHAFGKEKSAREVLGRAEETVRALSDRRPAKSSLLAQLARAWRDVGSVDRARALLKQAEPLVARAMGFERPGIDAYVAASYHGLGDEEDARRLLDRALTGAESLVNARPRALAVVEICRAMGREGMAVEVVRDRLDGLFEGLGDPW